MVYLFVYFRKSNENNSDKKNGFVWLRPYSQVMKTKQIYRLNLQIIYSLNNNYSNKAKFKIIINLIKKVHIYVITI